MSGKQGFASMSAERKREIASKGGRAAHAMGRAHQWTSDEARAAGQKGGRTAGQNAARKRAEAAAAQPTE